MFVKRRKKTIKEKSSKGGNKGEKLQCRRERGNEVGKEAIRMKAKGNGGKIDASTARYIP